MKVYMFQERFHDQVEFGIKRNTIRGFRKFPAKAGDKLSLRKWTGKPYRSNQQILMEAVCKDVKNLEIHDDEVMIQDNNFTIKHLRNGDTLNVFAIADGFTGWEDMKAWFKATHDLPFKGTITYW